MVVISVAKKRQLWVVISVVKSHFLRISRIERHSRKIQFFFILPKNPFG